MERDVHTIQQYCGLEQISRSKFYEEQKAGVGVEVFRRGARTFISEAARLRHREKLEQEARAARQAVDAKTAAGAVPAPVAAEPDITPTPKRQHSGRLVEAATPPPSRGAPTFASDIAGLEDAYAMRGRRTSKSRGPI